MRPRALPLTINIDSGAILAFGAAGFVPGTGMLNFGSANADNVVTLQNGLDVTAIGASTTAGITVNDNPGSSADYTVITGQITGGGNLNVFGPGLLVLSNTSTAAPNNYTGATTVSGATLRLGAANQISSAGALTLTGATLDRNGNSDTVTTLTMNNGTIIGSGVLSISTGSTTVNASGTASLSGGTLRMSGGGTPVFNLVNSGDTLYLGDALIGANQITKNGNGTLVFANTGNIFLHGGNTAVNAGTLRTDVSNVLADTGYGIAAGAILNLNGTYQVVSGIGGAGTINLNGGTIESNYYGLNFTGTTDGTGTYVVNTGSTAGQTWQGGTGDTTNNVAQLSNIAGYTFQSVVVEGNGIFGTAVVGTTITSLTAFNIQGGTVQAGLILSGTAGLNKTTSGTATISATLNYTGPTQIQAGTLLMASTGLPASGSLSMAGGVLQFTDTGAVVFNRAIGTGAGQIQFTGTSGGLAPTSSSLTITFSGGDVVWGSTGLADGQALLFGSSNGTSTGAITVTNNIDLHSLMQTVMVTDNAASTNDSTTLSGVLYDGGLIKSGTGTLYLTNSGNTFAGGLTVTNGILRLNASGTSLPSANAVTVSGGILDTQTAALSVNSLTLSGGTVAGLGSVSTSTINLQSGLISASLLGSGGATKTTTGTVVLSGNNAYTGTTNVTAGILALASGSALGSAGNATTVSIGATLALQGGIVVGGESLTLSGGGAAGAGGALENVSGLNTWTGSLTLGTATTVNVANGSLTLSGPINGSTSLTKTGNGLLVISNTTNGYGGGTVIQAGTLAASGLLGTGNVSISSGTLQITPGFSLTGASSVVISAAGDLEMFTDLASGVTLGGGTITSHGARTISGAIADAGSATFVTNNSTLTLSNTFTMTSDLHTWTVGTGSTVAVSGNISGSHVFEKLGNGTLLLQGTSNFSTLNVGFGSQPGGYVVANSTPAASVVIAPGSLYTVQVADYAYNEVNYGASSGVLGLSRSSNANLNFATGSSALYLGVYEPSGGVVNYTGTLTPYGDGVETGWGYLLGGGKGILNIVSALQNVLDEDFNPLPTNVTIGWQAPGQNPLSQGVVRLSGANQVTGTVNVYGNLQLGNSAALSTVAVTNVFDGGSFDINNQTGYNVIAAVNAGVLVMQPAGNVGGGGSIANSGSNLTQAMMAALFPISATSTYKVGGGGTGSTSIDDGALLDQAGSMNLEKDGTSTVVLAAVPGYSANTYSGATTVNNGTLQVPSVASIASTSAIQINGTGILDFTGSGSLSQTITFGTTGTVRVESGNTITVASLNLDGPTTSATLAGGGTLAATGILSAGGILNITGTSTLSIPWTYSTPDPGPRFVVANTGTLLFSSNTSTSNGIGDSIGTVMPGGTIQFANDLNPGGTLALSRSAAGLVLDVPASQYPDLGTASFSSAGNPYTINLGDNTLQIGVMTQVGTGAIYVPAANLPALQTGQFVQGSVLHTPVAYIAVTGSGTLSMQEAMLSNDGDFFGRLRLRRHERLLARPGRHADEHDGRRRHLARRDGPGLVRGRPAGAHRPAAPGRHRGVQWRHAGLGRHAASLPASVYGGLAAGNGDGFNPNEFILDKGATLTNSYAALILGYQYTPVAGPVQNYGLPITVRSDTGNSTTPVNLGGAITAHSGIQMTTTGNVDLNVAPSSVITFANDIAGVGYTPVRSLTLNSTGLGNAANVTVAASFANTQTTTIQSRSTLTLNPGALTTISYAGNVVNNGTVHVTSGTVTNMGIISSSNPIAPSIVAFAGLQAGRVNTNGEDYTSVNPKTSVVADLSSMNTYGPSDGVVWVDNSTWIFTGQFYSTGGTYAFGKNFDDTVELIIDGATLIQSHAYATQVTVVDTLAVGWHNIEIRFGQDGGNVGPHDVFAGIALGYDPTGGANWANIPAADFQYTVSDPGQGFVSVDSAPSCRRPASAMWPVSPPTAR